VLLGGLPLFFLVPSSQRALTISLPIFFNLPNRIHTPAFHDHHDHLYWLSASLRFLSRGPFSFSASEGSLRAASKRDLASYANLQRGWLSFAGGGFTLELTLLRFETDPLEILSVGVGVDGAVSS